MEYIDICGGGQITTFVVKARGEQAAEWLCRLTRAPGKELPEPVRQADGTLVFRGPRVCAKLEDPTIEVEFDSSSDRGDVIATWGEAKVCLSNTLALPLPTSPNGESLLRPATLDECFELAMRWILGMGRIGCYCPTEAVFPWKRMSLGAFVATEGAVERLDLAVPPPIPWQVLLLFPIDFPFFEGGEMLFPWARAVRAEYCDGCYYADADLAGERRILVGGAVDVDPWPNQGDIIRQIRDEPGGLPFVRNEGDYVARIRR